MMLNNLRNYENPERVQEYVTLVLRPAETMIFVKYRSDIAGRRVIDIGCGAGRITRYLQRWTPHVTGIDFSRAMVEYCRHVLPLVPFVVCDASELTPFPDEAFDAALFTFNGIDTLPHERRRLALAGIHRTLSPGGLFMFSSHNRRYRYAHRGPRLQFGDPVRMVRRLPRFGREVVNHWKRKPLEREETEYAIINDLAHGFVMLHYYITREAQARQLADAGFDLLETYGEDGEVIRPGADDAGNGELYYVARRT